MDIPGLEEYAQAVGLDPASAARKIVEDYLTQWGQSPAERLMHMTKTMTIKEAIYAVEDATTGGTESVECDDALSCQVVPASVTLGAWNQYWVVYQWSQNHCYDVVAIETSRAVAVDQWRKAVLRYTEATPVVARGGMWAACNWLTTSPDLHWSGSWMDHHAIAA